MYGKINVNCKFVITMTYLVVGEDLVAESRQIYHKEILKGETRVINFDSLANSGSRHIQLYSMGIPSRI